jgi:hypothetical protein
MDKKMFENVTMRSSESFKAPISSRKNTNTNKPQKTFVRSSTSLMDKQDKSPKDNLIGKKLKSPNNPFELQKDFSTI